MGLPTKQVYIIAPSARSTVMTELCMHRHRLLTLCPLQQRSSQATPPLHGSWQRQHCCCSTGACLPHLCDWAVCHSPRREATGQHSCWQVARASSAPVQQQQQQQAVCQIQYAPHAERLLTRQLGTQPYVLLPCAASYHPSSAAVHHQCPPSLLQSREADAAVTQSTLLHSGRLLERQQAQCSG